VERIDVNSGTDERERKRGRTSPGTSTTGLLDVHGSTHELSRVESSDGSVGFVGVLHCHKGEPTRVLGVGVPHDLALLDLWKTPPRQSPPLPFHDADAQTYPSELGKDLIEIPVLDPRRETGNMEVVSRVHSSSSLGSATPVVPALVRLLLPPLVPPLVHAHGGAGTAAARLTAGRGRASSVSGGGGGSVEI
jgi:hypothetical protein